MIDFLLPFIERLDIDEIMQKNMTPELQNKLKTDIHEHLIEKMPKTTEKISIENSLITIREDENGVYVSLYHKSRIYKLIPLPEAMKLIIEFVIKNKTIGDGQGE